MKGAGFIPDKLLLDEDRVGALGPQDTNWNRELIARFKLQNSRKPLVCKGKSLRSLG